MEIYLCCIPVNLYYHIERPRRSLFKETEEYALHQRIRTGMGYSSHLILGVSAKNGYFVFLQQTKRWRSFSTQESQKSSRNWFQCIHWWFIWATTSFVRTGWFPFEKWRHGWSWSRKRDNNSSTFYRKIINQMACLRGTKSTATKRWKSFVPKDNARWQW